MSQRRFYALGTASQVPTRSRNHNGYFLRWDNEGLLFDPGEGTQRQMIFAELSSTQVSKIFITHFHGDHCLGLSGIIQRLSLDRVPHTVKIFYPASGQKYLDNLQNASIYHNLAKIEHVPISEEGVIFTGKNFRIEALRLDHTVETWGYRMLENDTFTMSPEKLEKYGICGRNVGILKAKGEIEIDGQLISVDQCGESKKGQVFSFVMDTRFCQNAIRLADDADLLVCESTYLKTETADAVKNGHLTAEQAAKIALKSRTKLLALTHFSQRYVSLKEFSEEAKEIFPASVVMRDGDFIDIPKRN